MDLHFVLFSLITIFCSLFQGSISMDTRIVDGSRIDISLLPFMLSLRLNDAHICGASIISRNWGLTAAHCVTTYKDTEHYSVRSGSSFINKGGTIHKVTSVVWHELYNDLSTDYDIAVFKVKRPFKFGKTRKAIDLPGNDYVYDDWAIIAGWGAFVENENELSEYLLYGIVPKVDRSSCANDYSGRYDLTPQQVCYGYEKSGQDACKGDSGGPLVTINSSIILGITSWGEDCEEVRLPGVYTTIFFMLDWIYEKTGVKSRL